MPQAILKNGVKTYIKVLIGIAPGNDFGPVVIESSCGWLVVGDGLQ